MKIVTCSLGLDVSTDQLTTESSDSSTVEYTSESQTTESSLYTEELMFSDSAYSSDGSIDVDSKDNRKF